MCAQLKCADIDRIGKAPQPINNKVQRWWWRDIQQNQVPKVSRKTLFWMNAHTEIVFLV